MADEKPLTIPNLIAALKEAGFVTKADLQSGLKSLREQIAQDQFEARTEFFTKMTKPAIEQAVQGLRAEINPRLEKIEADVIFIKRELSDIKANHATVPSREEIGILRTRVERLEKHIGLPVSA